jgi:hypothetical protein
MREKIVISNNLTRGIATAAAFLAFMSISAAHAETRHYFCKEEVRYDSDSKPTKITDSRPTTFTVEKGLFSSSVKMNDIITFNIVNSIGATTVAATLRTGPDMEHLSLIHTSAATADFTLYSESASDRGVIKGTCTFQIK